MFMSIRALMVYFYHDAVQRAKYKHRKHLKWHSFTKVTSKRIPMVRSQFESRALSGASPMFQ